MNRSLSWNVDSADSSVPSPGTQGQGVTERQRLWRKRKTEITVETWEETLMRGTTRQVVGRCGQCRGRSLMATPEEVHQALGVAVRRVWQAVESGEVHSRETLGGDLLVCLASLKEWLNGRPALGPAGTGAPKQED